MIKTKRDMTLHSAEGDKGAVQTWREGSISFLMNRVSLKSSWTLCVPRGFYEIKSVRIPVNRRNAAVILIRIIP